MVGMVIWKARELTRVLLVHEIHFGHCNHRAWEPMGNLQVYGDIQTSLFSGSAESSAVGGKYLLTSSVLTNSVSMKD